MFVLLVVVVIEVMLDGKGGVEGWNSFLARLRLFLCRFLFFVSIRSMTWFVHIGPVGGGWLNIVPSARNRRVLITLYLYISVCATAILSLLISTPVTLPSISPPSDRWCCRSDNMHNFAPGAQHRSNTCSEGFGSRACTATPEAKSIPYI